jgi:hypothetical protein
MRWPSIHHDRDDDDGALFVAARYRRTGADSKHGAIGDSPRDARRSTKELSPPDATQATGTTAIDIGSECDKVWERLLFPACCDDRGEAVDVARCSRQQDARRHARSRAGYPDVELDIYDVKSQTMVRSVYFDENAALDASSLFLWRRKVLVLRGLCVADASLERLAGPQASTI